MYAIKTTDLTKKFKELTAVHQLNLEIEKGELFGMLGPNGAGKTTTLKMLSTLIKPTSGTAEVWGHNIETQKDQVRSNIGMVFQDPSLDIRLTGEENLDFHARMYGLPKQKRKERINEVLNLVELTEHKKTMVINYSGGMKRRLEIARGLMHFPHVLFLDEPTLGLDPQTRRRIWDYIKMMTEEKEVTIILTTHYMDEADYLCDRIAIMDFGKIVALDSSKNLKDSIGTDVISLQLDDGEEQFFELLKGISWVKKISEHDEIIDLNVQQGETRIPEIVNLAQRAGTQIRSVNLREPTLEDVFLQYTGRTIREGDGGSKALMREHVRSMRRRS
ncbi:MAG: ATP-binding cassette domain-containing protein [Candidatus Jordarchaeum sp.]|uniref:ATP-binding cassette domain-containing protein n=1 Tax=Candidatus Jordarchaeum sp. TaxID=2823881 RepID=UPI004048F729